MAKSDKKKLRVALIGSGGIAGTHTDNYVKFPEVEVVAACDVNETVLQKFGDKYNVKKLYPDWKPLLKECEVDAVSVCTPNGLHMQPTVDALNAGCHVLVEKPMAMNVAEAQKMYDAAKKNKKHLVIGFQYRFDSRIRILKKAIDDGLFGKILYVRIQALRRRGIPNWGVFGRKELQGGGPLIDIGVHAIEMAHYAIGSPEPVSAFGNCWTYMGNKPSDVASMWPNWDYKTYTVEDLAVGSLRMKGGAIIQVEASFATHIEKDVWNFQVFGEKAGATFDPFQICFDHAGMMVNGTPGYIPRSEIFPAKMRHFVDVCLNDRKCEAPAEHGLMVQKMLDGIYAAAAAGKEVKID
jgi:predicted dehydrogenase